MNNFAYVPTILVIEHDAQSQQLAQRALTAEGFKVLSASKWQLGISLAREARPDLILMALDVPGIGGEGLAVRLRSLPELKRTAIVALGDSATDGDSHSHVLAAGCNGILSKPIDPVTLVSQVESFLRGRTESVEPGKRLMALETLVQALASRLEQQTMDLESSTRQLKEAYQTTDNFLVAASRELRTPLTLLNGYVTLLQSTVAHLGLEQVPLSLVEMADGLSQGTKRLNDIVQELLRISRIVTGDISLAIGPTRFSRLISIALEELGGSASSIQVSNLNKLPIIQADGNQIRLAVRNILSYFLSTVPEGAAISIDGERQQDIVIISIQGSGIQVEPTEREVLFDRFYPVSGSKPKAGRNGQPSGGLGFGLAVAKGIIQAHGGRIWAENINESACSFYVLLPIFSPAYNGIVEPAGT